MSKDAEVIPKPIRLILWFTDFLVVIPLPGGVRPGAISRSWPPLNLLLWLWAAYLPWNARRAELPFYHYITVCLLYIPFYPLQGNNCLCRMLWAFEITPASGAGEALVLPSVNNFMGGLVVRPPPFVYSLKARSGDTKEFIMAEAKEAEVHVAAWKAASE